jgi:hypothetical protein
MSSPEPLLIEKTKVEINNKKLNIERRARTTADSEQKDEDLFVSQPCSKPKVSGSCFRREVISLILFLLKLQQCLS